MRIAIALALALFFGFAAVGDARPPVVHNLPAGDSVVYTDGGSFLVSSNVPISVSLGFSGDAVIEGAINVPGGGSAQVEIVWRETDLSIFAGTVHTSHTIRYIIPPDFQAAVDIGHSEK